MADEHIYTKNGIDQSHDIVTRLREQAQAPALAWLTDAADEIERLREQEAEMLPLFEDIVIGKRIRERAANDNGRRTPLGEVAADFGIDLDADEIERLRAEVERLRADVARLGSFLHPIGDKARRG